jgi:perosamine synthetase
MSSKNLCNDLVNFIKSHSDSNDFIPLHAPSFSGNEKKYIDECIDSTFVSSVGEFVNKVEEKVANYTGSKFAIATNSGTSALHIGLILANVKGGDEVITQPLSFIATCNAISYCGASPVFIDVDKDTMGLSPKSLYKFLKINTIFKNGQCINKSSGNVIKACLPMHTYGHPCRIDEILEICIKFKITLVEDAAESLGSKYKGKHTGTFGSIGAISFNGNKIITAGGGGCIITNNESLAKKAKHLTTTAKLLHKWDFSHDMIGYNYRMPNLNAALLCGQLENLDDFLIKKRELAQKYIDFFENTEVNFAIEPKDSESNYWLNSIILKDKIERDMFLNSINSQGVMIRPAWGLMNKQPMFNFYQAGHLENAEWLESRVVNIPSSPNLMNF